MSSSWVRPAHTHSHAWPHPHTHCGLQWIAMRSISCGSCDTPVVGEADAPAAPNTPSGPLQHLPATLLACPCRRCHACTASMGPSTHPHRDCCGCHSTVTCGSPRPVLTSCPPTQHIGGQRIGWPGGEVGAPADISRATAAHGSWRAAVQAWWAHTWRARALWSKRAVVAAARTHG